jgi:hypothetical protein
MRSGQVAVRGECKWCGRFVKWVAMTPEVLARLPPPPAKG